MENQYPTSSATCPTRGSHHHMPWHLPGSPTCVRLVSRARAGNTWPSRPPPPPSVSKPSAAVTCCLSRYFQFPHPFVSVYPKLIFCPPLLVPFPFLLLQPFFPRHSVIFLRTLPLLPALLHSYLFNIPYSLSPLRSLIITFVLAP